EVAAIRTWEATGSRAGNPNDAPPPRDAGALAPVSRTLDVGAAYTPAAGEDFRCFMLDPALTQAQDLVAFEFVPGAPKIVHHVLLCELPLAVASGLDGADTGVGWSCYGIPGSADGGLPRTLGSWNPGIGVVRLPDTTGLRLTPGNAVVMQIHYISSATTVK